MGSVNTSYRSPPAGALAYEKSLRDSGLDDESVKSKMISRYGDRESNAVDETSSTDSAKSSKASSSKKAPEGAEELEKVLRAMGLSEDQIKTVMKKLFGDKGKEGSTGTATGLSAGSTELADAITAALESAGVSSSKIKSILSQLTSATKAENDGTVAAITTGASGFSSGTNAYSGGTFGWQSK